MLVVFSCGVLGAVGEEKWYFWLEQRRKSGALYYYFYVFLSVWAWVFQFSPFPLFVGMSCFYFEEVGTVHSLPPSFSFLVELGQFELII
jgi:hypothetical protein